MRVKKSADLTLHDVLSQLTLPQAQKCLGPAAAALIPKTGGIEINPAEQVQFRPDYFQCVFPEALGGDEPVVVTLSLHPGNRDRLQVACSHTCEEALIYPAAVMAMILEEKFALGLSTEPRTDLPWELLSEQELDARALAERRQRAEEEPMKVRIAPGADGPWADYTVSSALSGKSYRVALRGRAQGQSYCSCPDFRRNHLGTCKHVLRVLRFAAKKFGAALDRPWRPDALAIHARYDGELRLALDIPSRLKPALRPLLEPWRGREVGSGPAMRELFELIRTLTRMDEEFILYPDAEEFLNAELHQLGLAELVAEIRANPAAHPLRTGLLRAELLPYQLDGVAFAAGCGRAVLADEMGLGKTIQGVGVAELLARHAGVRRVLVVCPASLKSQWRNEVQKFSGRSVQLISGKLAERAALYQGEAFFTVCNYEQVLRDYLEIERTHWDMIILDEAQRIKNWEAKTSRIIKGLRSRFALVLTGTPLENRLDDLYSVVEFIDPRRLGPAYRFINTYRVATDTGRVTGFKNLAHLRERLKPILLRRTRHSIALDLPPRSTELVRIPPTDEQLQLHGAHMTVVHQITNKKFLTQMDLLRLQKALLMARMSADGTVLVDKQPPGFSSKLERLAELLENLQQEPERKIIVFSEWTTMLNQIAPILKRLDMGYVRLDGAVPQKQRQALVNEFQTNPDCRVFLTTNAGSTGLNLQAADTVINVDLPWNPALLEQRIARAHRMGQKRPVQVYLLVTEGTIEEGLLLTLSAKHELAAAVLDPDSDLNEVQLTSGVDELKRRLEILLGAKPEAAVDVSTIPAPPPQPQPLSPERQALIATAGGQLITSALTLLGASLGRPEPAAAQVQQLRDSLAHCVETDAEGRSRLSLNLPDPGSLDQIAKALAMLLTPPP
jgi:superfamily II DNA or RNA helicase